MMEPDCRARLLAVATEVLAKQAFLFAAEGKLADGQAPDGSLHAAIVFSGPTRGTMELAAPMDLCAELAGNLLGLEPGHPDAAANAADALKELLNVACSHYLSAAHGSGPVFRLSVPVVTEIDAARWATLAASDTAVVLDVDGTPALLRYAGEATA
jgi:CheY-specific phosphatase CheX